MPTAAARTATAPRVSVVTVNDRQPQVTAELLTSLRACTYPNLEVVLVDGGSDADERARFAYHFPGVVYVRTPTRPGFAGGSNVGLRHATGELILLLANDTLVAPDFLGPLVELLSQKPDVGIASPKVLTAGARVEYAGAVLAGAVRGRTHQIGYGEADADRYDDTRETDLPSGTCLLVRREVFAAVGLLPVDYFLYFETADFALAARRAGYRTMYCGASRVTHRHTVPHGYGDDRRSYDFHHDRLRFHRRALGLLSYVALVLYYWCVAIPAAALRFWRKPNRRQLRAMGRALRHEVRQGVGPEEPLALPHLTSAVTADD